MSLDTTSKEHYDTVLKSGMFFEWYPLLTGNWEADKSIWIATHSIVSSEQQIKVEINKAPSFTEIWHEGSVTFNDKQYMFWLINPTGKDEEGREYEMEVRWWFKQVPMAIRKMSETIINDFIYGYFIVFK